jgi:hypothetical protein
VRRPRWVTLKTSRPLVMTKSMAASGRRGLDVGDGHRPEAVDVAELAGSGVASLQGGAVDADDDAGVGSYRLPLRRCRRCGWGRRPVGRGRGACRRRGTRRWAGVAARVRQVHVLVVLIAVDGAAEHREPFVVGWCGAGGAIGTVGWCGGPGGIGGVRSLMVEIDDAGPGQGGVVGQGVGALPPALSASEGEGTFKVRLQLGVEQGDLVGGPVEPPPPFAHGVRAGGPRPVAVGGPGPGVVVAQCRGLAGLRLTRELAERRRPGGVQQRLLGGGVRGCPVGHCLGLVRGELPVADRV